MSTATKTPKKKQTRHTEVGPRARGLTLPSELDLPAKIEAANDAAIEAAVAMTEAEAEQAEAGREYRGAALADQAAARAAVEAGETVVNLTAAAKQERVKHSQARAQAAQKLVSLRAWELREAIRKDEHYLADRSADHAAASSETSDSIDGLVEAWAKLLQSTAVVRPARRIVEQSWSGAVAEDYLTEDALRERVAKALDSRRARGTRDLPKFEQLVADLLFHLEQPA